MTLTVTVCVCVCEGFGWTAALLHPDVFPIYSAMSVPYFPRSPHAPLPIEGGMRSTYGDERAYRLCRVYT